jgi:hypothetical protein
MHENNNIPCFVQTRTSNAVQNCTTLRFFISGKPFSKPKIRLLLLLLGLELTKRIFSDLFFSSPGILIAP